MATPTIDLTLLKFLSPIFVFLLVFALTYALATKSKFFGDNKIVHMVVALCLASLVAITGRISTTLELALPWMGLFLVLIVLIFSIYGFFGIETKRTWDFLGRPALIGLIFLVFIISIVIAYEDVLSPYPTTEEVTLENGTVVIQEAEPSQSPMGEGIKALVHPKIMGALVILIIAAITAKLLGEKLKTDD